MNDSVNKIGREGRAPAAPEPALPAPSAPWVRDLTKIYGAVTAVDRISFTLAQGTTVALLGGNGAGKTTTIAMLLGLVVPTSGEVRVFGADMSRNRGAVAHRMNFQSPYVDLPARLTVQQNLTVYAGLYGIANAAERIAYIAEDLQIEPLLDRPTGKLSAGQKTRVGPRQGSAQRARPSPARRAHRLARSRHRRLDQAQAQGLCRDARRHPSACLAQHGGGRAARRSRHPARIRDASSRTRRRPL